jgi:DNA-binding transcriptional ArsR family regulator
MKAKSTNHVLDIDQIDKAADRLKSITHPMRIAIIELLIEKEKLSVTEIYRKLKILQAAASIHLKILKEKGVLTSRRDGRKIIYAVNTKNLTVIIDCINRCNAD